MLTINTVLALASLYAIMQPRCQTKIFFIFKSKMPHPITISPDIQSGEPVFTNTRVPIKNLFDYLKAGHPLNDFLEDFPSVTKEQAIQVLNHFENLLNFHLPEHV